MTNWIGTQTQRFRCLITHASIVTMANFTGTTAPACSMCSITPPMKVRWPSDRQSTSHSMASLRKRSSSTGESLETFTASRM